ncbi:MAG: transposase [Acidimicrobiaceae bacterium]|nr:transposase [Acidimicrobiaceae bacterium]
MGLDLAEICYTSLSRETISKITEGIVADMSAWQNRPLDPCFACKGQSVGAGTVMTWC